MHVEIAWGKVLPVLVSIVIIIAVAVLREHSKSLAGILATMPVNIPLALWIVYAAENGERVAVVQLTDAMLIGIVPTVIFLVVVWGASRAGWGLLPMLAAGYGAWFVMLGVVLLARRLVGG
jgi:hypothetical protein